MTSITEHTKGNWHLLARKKTDLQTVHGSGTEKKYEDWKRSKTRMPFVTDSIQLVQRVPY